MRNNARTIASLEIITALGIILFWIGFFTIGLAPENPPKCYFVFEYSFPLPDIMLAAVMLCSGVLLLKQKPFGKALALVSAGGLAFLGVLDFSFNIQNGIYALSAVDLLLNGFINLWCFVFGIMIITRFRDI